VRHRGGEAAAQLLVGGQVADLAEVDEALLAAVDDVRHDDRHPPGLPGEERLREAGTLPHAVDRLPRAPTGGQHAPLVVEDDDSLAALLDEDPAPLRLGVHRRRCTGSLRAGGGGGAASPSGYHPATTSRPPSIQLLNMI
jgi:hypothetical protein